MAEGNLIKYDGFSLVKDTVPLIREVGYDWGTHATNKQWATPEQISKTVHWYFGDPQDYFSPDQPKTLTREEMIQVLVDNYGGSFQNLVDRLISKGYQMVRR